MFLGNFFKKKMSKFDRKLLAWRDPGILLQICFLLAEGVLFFILVLLIDYQVFKRMFDSIYTKIMLTIRSYESDKKKTKDKNALNVRTPNMDRKLRNSFSSRAQSKRIQKKAQKKLLQQKNKLKMQDERDAGDTIEEEEDNLILFEDDDVLREKRFIKGLRSGDLSKRSLVVDQLSKYYGGFLAVDAVSFQVKKRECVGICGVSGSGKSTVLRTLINEIAPTSGEFFIKGQKVKFRPDNSKKEVGYCPQNDAFFTNLTGRENLKIFLLCRGIEWRNLNQFSNELACTFHISKILDTKSKYYSRGSRRKLSLAIAMIGPPTLLLFDGPTANIDPTSKRRIWDVINKLRDTSKSIVIASNNVDECESLCTRMSIMVNGKLMCMGSKQHLGDKYSQGCILTIKFLTEFEHDKAHAASVEDLPSKRRSSTPVTDLEDFIQNKFPDAKLRQRLHGYRIYYIPTNNFKWADIFETMERYRKVLRIQDYSIGKKSLEEIYLDFSKHQKTRESNL